MKILKLFPICMLMLMACFYNSAFAKIWRVNQGGAGADFTGYDLQPAIDAVSAGDTIQVEGTNTTSSYTFTCTKRLTIIGPGYLLTQNPKTQSNTNTALIGGTFSPGSDGSVLMGFTINSINIRANNIKISRNYNGSIYFGTEDNDNNTYSNDTIEQNYDIYIQNYSEDSPQFSNLQINNNIISGMQLLANYTGVLDNNIIDELWSGRLGNFLVENNIIDGDTTDIAATNVFKNNILNSDPFTNTSPNGNGNFYVSDFTSLFVDWDDLFNPPTPGTDSDAKLKVGSPAIGKGVGGVDLGAFGGAHPYILSGMPNVPGIYQLVVPVTFNGSSMPVTISIKSHD